MTNGDVNELQERKINDIEDLEKCTKNTWQNSVDIFNICPLPTTPINDLSCFFIYVFDLLDQFLSASSFCCQE